MLLLSIFLLVPTVVIECQHFLNRNQLIERLQQHQFTDTILQAEDNKQCTIQHWNVSGVKDFTGVFAGFQSTRMEHLNLSAWDMSSAVTLKDMFHSATYYTGVGLEHWNVSSVEHFNQMFLDAGDFNGNIGEWNVSKGVHFGKMFEQSGFNASTLSWNLSSAQHVNDMFAKSPFDADVSGTTPPLKLTKMFRHATIFTGIGVETWDMSRVSSIERAFEYAYAFNGNVSKWTFPELTSASHAFRDAFVFNGDVRTWGMSKVSNFVATFASAKAFEGTGVGSWDLNSAVRFDHCFRGAKVFNGIIPQMPNMQHMGYAFHGASAFNRTMSTIPSKVTSLPYTFAGTRVSGIIIPLTITSLYGTFQSHIGTLNVSSWDVSNVHTMTRAFAYSTFNGLGVQHWSTSSLKNANFIFYKSEFDANVSSWDTSKVVTFASLFRETPMNHSVAKWNISSVTSMNRMFYGASAYCESWPWEGVGARDIHQIYDQAGTSCGGEIPPPPTLAPTHTPSSDDVHDSDNSDNSDTASTASTGPYYSLVGGIHEGPYYKTKSACEAEWGDCHDGHEGVTITHVHNGTYVDFQGTQSSDYWYPSGPQPDNTSIPYYTHTAVHATYPCTFTSLTVLGTALVAKCDGDTTYDTSTINSPCSIDEPSVASWDVSALTSLHTAFQGLDCALNVTGWDVSAVTDMSYMLYQVGPSFSITGLETWSTTNLRNLNNFAEQSQAKESAIKGLENWDVSDVTTMHKAFAGYHYPNNFNDDLSKWDVQNVTTMNQMFREARLFWAEIGMWNTSSLQTKPDGRYAGTTRIFENADAIHKTPPTNLARWDFCRGPAPSDFPVHAQRYNGSDWCANNTDPVDDRDAHTHPADDISFYWTKSACEDNSSLVDEACISVALEPKADYGHVWVWNRTQFKCKFTTNANLKYAIHAKCRNGTIDSTALTTVHKIADLCRTAVNISTWDVSEVTSLSSMFVDVGNPPCDLTGIGEWDVSSVTNMDHAFSSWANPQDGKAPGSWRNLDLSRWNMSQVTNIRRIFYYSTHVDIGDISDWDLCDITDSPGDLGDFFWSKRNQNDFRRLPGKPLCDPTRDESAPYESGDRMYYFNEAACGERCDSQYVHHDLGTMWYDDTFTTPTLICGSNRSLYDSPVGCAAANGGLSCAKSPEGRYLLNIDADCGTHYVSEAACTHVRETCVERNGMYMTEAQRVAHWQCVFTAKSTLLTAVRWWCGNGYPLGLENPNRYPTYVPPDHDAIVSKYGPCTEDISQWDVSAVTTMDWLFAAGWHTYRLNKTCNPDISNWDVSSVTSMSQMLRGHTGFTRDLSSWNTAKVTTINSMVHGNSAYKNIFQVRELAKWNYCSLKSERHMKVLGKITQYHVPGSEFCNNWEAVESCGASELNSELRASRHNTTLNALGGGDVRDALLTDGSLTVLMTKIDNKKSRIELRRALRAYGASRDDAKAIFQLARSDFMDILGGFAEKARSRVQVPQPGTRTTMDFDVDSVYVPMEAGDDSTLIIDAHAGTERARLCIKPGATESSNYSVLVTRGREVYDLCENTNCTEGNTVARSENDYFINVTLGSASANGGHPNATDAPTSAPTSTLAPIPVPTPSPIVNTKAPTSTLAPISVPTPSPIVNTKAPTSTPAPTPSPTPCFSPETLIRTSSGYVQALDVHIGMLIVGENTTSRVIAVDQWNSSGITVCVVPTGFCSLGSGSIVAAPTLVTPNHALRCDKWEPGLWTFCESTWQRTTIDSVINIQLESYFNDSISIGNGIILESWNGAYPGEVCGTHSNQCPIPHGWLVRSFHPLRISRLLVKNK